jgi:hypothetical protein
MAVRGNHASKVIFEDATVWNFQKDNLVEAFFASVVALKTKPFSTVWKFPHRYRRFRETDLTWQNNSARHGKNADRSSPIFGKESGAAARDWAACRGACRWPLRRNAPVRTAAEPVLAAGTLENSPAADAADERASLRLSSPQPAVRRAAVQAGPGAMPRRDPAAQQGAGRG